MDSLNRHNFRPICSVLKISYVTCWDKSFFPVHPLKMTADFLHAKKSEIEKSVASTAEKAYFKLIGSLKFKNKQTNVAQNKFLCL